MIPHRQIIENVGFFNISNNVHEVGETSGAKSIENSGLRTIQ